MKLGKTKRNDLISKTDIEIRVTAEPARTVETDDADIETAITELVNEATGPA
jgi:hypothetical protein